MRMPSSKEATARVRPILTESPLPGAKNSQNSPCFHACCPRMLPGRAQWVTSTHEAVTIASSRGRAAQGERDRWRACADHVADVDPLPTGLVSAGATVDATVNLSRRLQRALRVLQLLVVARVAHDRVGNGALDGPCGVALAGFGIAPAAHDAPPRLLLVCEEGAVGLVQAEQRARRS
eukprot:scaffold39048_cov70-Phaeocystis_antarctica.AAC.4